MGGEPPLEGSKPERTSASETQPFPAPPPAGAPATDSEPPARPADTGVPPTVLALPEPHGPSAGPPPPPRPPRPPRPPDETLLPEAPAVEPTQLADRAACVTQPADLAADGALPAAAPAPARAPAYAGEPTSLGRYRLESLLGRGGMGAVYRAFDPQLRRAVALKVMLGTEAYTEEARQRFQREVRLAGRLHHPNIVPVYEAGEIDGKLYYTMELVAGEGLDAVLKRMGTLPPRAAARIVRDAARGLQAAHREGIVHRDIKPQNLLVTAADAETKDRRAADTTIRFAGSETAAFRVLVTDFGLAKDVSSESRLSRTGEVMGTLLYMSPEQAGGDIGRIGPASDVYSLGAVLYELLCGKPPFEPAPAIQMMAAIVTKDPPPLRTRAPGLHPDLGTITAKSMEKDPARRYEGAGALAEDLDRFLAGEVIDARPASRAYRAWRAAVRHRNVVLPAAAALLIVTGVLAWPPLRAAWERRRAEAERAGREHASATLLEKARETLARGDKAGEPEARALAEELLNRFGAEAERGENHPIAEAHAALAEVHGRGGDATRALVERFRAYRVAASRDSARPFLLDLARQLVDLSRFDEARGVLLRVLGHAVADDDVAAQARYELGRCAEGGMDLDGAADLFRQAFAGSLPVALRASCGRHRAFCELFAGETELKIRLIHPCIADLDGDGRCEVLTFTDPTASVVVGGFADDGRWQEKARWPIPADLPFALGALGAEDLDGDGRKEVLVAGGNGNGQGAIFVLKCTGGSLSAVGRGPFEGGLRSHPFAVGDLDGDGDPEILLGSHHYQPRKIWIYTWRRAAGKLESRGAFPVGGDVVRLLVRDLDGSGRSEIVSFEGAWGSYGIRTYRLSGNSVEPAGGLRLGVPTTVTEGLDAGDRTIAFGTMWWRNCVDPLYTLLGKQGFRAAYRPPGTWRLRPGVPLEEALEPIETGDWADGDDGNYGVAQLRGPGGSSYLWSIGRMNGFADAVVERERGGANSTLFVREGGRWARLARIQVGEPPWNNPGENPVFFDGDWMAPILAADLDGDGEDEILDAGLSAWSSTLNFRYVRGLRGVARRAAASTGVAVAGGSSPGGETKSGTAGAAPPDRVEVAHDAEAFRLWDEARVAYEQLLGAGAEGPEAFLAEQGLLRSLVALDKPEEVAAEAERACVRWPGRTGELLPPCIEALRAARRWELAGRLLQLRLAGPGLDAAGRETGRAAVVEMRALAAAPFSKTLLGPRAEQVDWLVSSPLAVQRKGDGLRIDTPSTLGQFCVTPVWLEGAGQALRARLSIDRLDAETSLWLALSDAAPWAAGYSMWSFRPGGNVWACRLGVAGRGDQQFPARELVVGHAAPDVGNMRIVVRRGSGFFPEFSSVEAVLRYLPYPFRVGGSVAWGEDRVEERWAAAGPPGGVQGFAGFEAPSGGSPAFAYLGLGTYRVGTLDLDVPGDKSKLREFTPFTALDQLCLANGRWVWGRFDEAGAAYDRAVRLAEEDLELRERRKKDGVLVDAGQKAEDPSFYAVAAQDARLYRGLFRWSRGERAGGLDDLRRAWARDPARVRWILAGFGAALEGRPSEAEALRELWLAEAGGAGGVAEGEARDALVRRAFQELGGHEPAARAVSALFGGLGYAATIELVVTQAPPAAGNVGAAAAAGPAIGDVLVACEGRPVLRLPDLYDARGAAVEQGKGSVTLRVRRGAAELGVVVPAAMTGLDWGQRLSITKDGKPLPDPAATVPGLASFAAAEPSVQAGRYAEARKLYEEGLSRFESWARAAAPERRRVVEEAARGALLGAHYNLACILSLASAGRDGPGVSPSAARAVEPAEAARLADSAFLHLRESVRLGWRDAAHLAADTDLEPLHADARWAEVVAEAGK
ncbi:MAG: protein kinase [Planctomycetes bacterium]|nr:protein kinase [Planctomycetota bacterium]